MKDLKIKIGLIVCSCIISLIFAEIVMRVHAIWDPLTLRSVDGDKKGTCIRFNKYADHVSIPFCKEYRKLSDEDKKEGINSVAIEYNSNGIRGPEIGRKVGPRVLLLGDSFLQADELPITDSIGAMLNSRQLHGTEVIQHGIPSWSPVTEFAWFFHFAQGLDVDRIYLFLYDNDFFSECCFYYGDEKYRNKFVFNKKGIPLFIPELKPSFLMKNSYLARHIKYNVIEAIQPKWRQVLRLYREKIPLPEKNSRIFKRIFKRTPIYPPYCPKDCHTKASQLFKQHVIEEKFDWCKRVFVEMVMLRLPISEWDEVLHNAVDAAIKSITDFNNYLQEQEIELYVVYIPAGFEIDKGEHEAGNSFREGYRCLPTGSQGLEDYLRLELAKIGVSVIDLKKPLNEYKKKKCPQCENFLYYKYDGHWNIAGHRVVANAIEEHLLQHSIK